jgi:hypothetical protein
MTWGIGGMNEEKASKNCEKNSKNLRKNVKKSQKIFGIFWSRYNYFPINILE